MTNLNKFWGAGMALATLIAFGAMPAHATNIKGAKHVDGPASASIQIDGVDFGDDSSAWANDGECDDPRFEGPGTAVELIEEDKARDATDCSTLYQAGEISLVPAPDEIVAGINFGDNTSEWANDGECDDPRFDGAGTDDILLDEDMARDANDCRTLFLSGDIIYLGDDPNMDSITLDGINFGDNTSEWANDLECDDPRFAGNGMAAELVAEDQGRDASDCLTLYQSGDIALAAVNTSPGGISPAPVDFGDDTSSWANDGECDDPRFEGPGSADLLLEEDLGRDATDCSALFAAGQITLIDQGGGTSQVVDGFDFGDDTSSWANDGECDDPRFEGPGTAGLLLDDDLGRDATDCRTLFASGDITIIDGADGIGPVMIDFGTDESRWNNDGECDDPRFFGEGMAAKLILEDLGRDATDCRTLFDANQIFLTDAVNFDFGTDDSRWANDGECDDPRFIGEGMAVKLDPLDFARDASDCQAAFEAGTVEYAGGFLTMASNNNTATAAIDFGDDTSAWSNDGECDDPRFAGPGVAATLLDDDLGRDATDCRALFDAGEIYLISTGGGGGIDPASGIDFGDNTSDYANNNECDDPRFAGSGVAGVLLDEDLGRDADDCFALYNAGQIGLLADFFISFGDDSGEWANDEECDDPRFAGKAMADPLTDGNIERDASDCRAAFELGKIYLIADGPVDFGDNSSEWSDDNECDDPRFAGPGSSGSPLEENLMRDANDCRTLYRTSQIYLK